MTGKNTTVTKIVKEHRHWQGELSYDLTLTVTKG